MFNNPLKGNCAACHPSSRGPNGERPLFTDFTYDNIGVPRNYAIPATADPAYFDLGLCALPIEDPAFKVVGSSRYVAFARILDEIRFWAGPSSNASAEASQMGVLGSVDDAVALAARYLEG